MDFIKNIFKKKKEKFNLQNALVKIVEDPFSLHKIVLWIDPNNNQKENLSYAAQIKHFLPDLKIIMVQTAEEAYNILSKDEYKFKFIHVIMSGGISLQFMKDFENYMKKLKILTANIIFCSNLKYWSSQTYSNDSYRK